MKRTLLIFAGVVLALLALGYVLFQAIIAEPEASSLKSAEQRDSHDDGRSRRATLAGDAALAARPAQGPDGGVTDISTGLSVREQDGVVEYHRPNQPWKKLAADTKLSVQDTIKTKPGAGITLVFGGGSTVRMDGRTEVRVAESSQNRIAIKIKRGRAAVNHEPTRPMVFRIESTETKAAVEATRARFAVLGTDKRLAVAATRGTVNLTARKKTVAIRAGQQSTVAAGNTPSAPRRIPVSVLLRVARPRQRILHQRFVVLSGQTAVGTELHINTVLVKTNNNGAFRVRIPLQIGRNKLLAVARDVSGHMKRMDLGVLIVRPARPNSGVTGIKVKWD